MSGTLDDFARELDPDLERLYSRWLYEGLDKVHLRTPLRHNGHLFWALTATQRADVALRFNLVRTGFTPVLGRP